MFVYSCICVCLRVLMQAFLGVPYAIILTLTGRIASSIVHATCFGIFVGFLFWVHGYFSYFVSASLMYCTRHYERPMAKSTSRMVIRAWRRTQPQVVWASATDAHSSFVYQYIILSTHCRQDPTSS